MKYFSVFFIVVVFAAACFAAMAEPDSASVAEKKTEKRGIYGLGYGGGFYGGLGGYGGHGGSYGGIGIPYYGGGGYYGGHAPYVGHGGYYPYHGFGYH